MKKKLGRCLLPLCIGVTVIGLITTGCKSIPNRYDASFLSLFDTVTKVVGYAEDKESFTEDVQFIHDTLEGYHQLYDIYNSYEGVVSLKDVNEQAADGPVQVDQRTMDLLVYAKEMYTLTNGKTNVAFGAVLQVWHDYREAGTEDPENASLPPMDLLEEKRQHTNIDDLILDEENLTVFFADPELQLDVGAIAKGYATEQTARLAEEAGINHMLLSVGGNIRAIGSKYDSSGNEIPWNVGVMNPDESSDIENLFTVNLTDLSLVTSGIYERYYTVNGVQYHHLIDPDTLMPGTKYICVTIACRDSGLADALSTAIFLMDFEDGASLIESLDGVEAFWMLSDGEEKFTSGFQDMIKEMYIDGETNESE